MMHPANIKAFVPFPTWQECKLLPTTLRHAYQNLTPRLRKTLLISGVVHLILVGLHIIPNDAFKTWDKEALEVVLVNAHSDANPNEVNAAVIAQNTLRGGGEADNDLVKSPLPHMAQTSDGDALIAAQRQVQMLERQQAELMATLKSQLQVNTQIGTNRSFNPKPGTAQDNTADAFMRQIAVLDKNVNDYNSRPKRKQISPATKEAIYATYYAQWSERLERLGTENYPARAKGRSGEVVVTVSIRPNGKLNGIEVVHISGDKNLGIAAIQLLQQLAPYQQFPKNLSERLDILDITTRLIFTPAQKITAETLSNAP